MKRRPIIGQIVASPDTCLVLIGEGRDFWDMLFLIQWEIVTIIVETQILKGKRAILRGETFVGHPEIIAFICYCLPICHFINTHAVMPNLIPDHMICPYGLYLKYVQIFSYSIHLH